RIHKLLSTPQNPADAMLRGLDTISPDGLAALTQVAHGSTVATNAILERKGAKTALITTQGFRDVLFIGRQNRPDLYALHPQLPEPLIPREFCYDIPERLDFEGEILVPLDLAALDAILDKLIENEIESIAVCLLFSFVNPDHENAIRDRILERGILSDEQIALSSQVLPEFREYERASTVALEAYVRPVMTRYITHLRQQLPEKTGLRIMKSDGGVMSADTISRQAIQTALSGPAAGLIGALHIAQLAGYDNIITLDMGGTSTDVALCPGKLQYSANSQVDGLPLRARLLDIETIGAGGGSIARLDAGGALRVGPESAGAMPGPIIYGRGGTQITVSDANTLLGRLDPTRFPDNQIMPDIEAVETAFDTLSAQSKLTPIEAAKGVIDVANVNIDRALRRVSIARGYDPRDFTLVAFGGAGPLHACEVAERLNIQRVLIPRYPGVLCALGLLMADVRLDESRSIMAQATPQNLKHLELIRDDLLEIGRAQLAQENIANDDMRFELLLEMRYTGQAYELSIPFNDDPIAEFHHVHEQTYGHALPDRPVEIVNLRLRATGIIEKPDIQHEKLKKLSAKKARIKIKKSANKQHIPRYNREKLHPGMTFAGEALVFQQDSTIYIAPGWQVQVDGYRNL
ncbi:MAG: hydantoinase/oxoprolinase family protein, partial [Aggregatilineales bacterium]